MLKWLNLLKKDAGGKKNYALGRRVSFGVGEWLFVRQDERKASQLFTAIASYTLGYFTSRGKQCP